LNRVKLDEVKLFSPTEIEYLKEMEKASSAGVWTLTSPDGENGHAGTVLCEVAFVVVETPDEIGQVIAVYRAKLLDGEATALNLTQHWGFNLGASATSKGKPTPASKIGISDHHLKLKTKSILNLDAKDSLPTGTVLPLSSVDEKNFGGEGKTIGHAGKGYPSPSTTENKMGQGFPGEGYDDFWVFDRAGRTDIAVPEESLSTLNVFKDIEKE
jgi:aldose 1-epimerase